MRSSQGVYVKAAYLTNFLKLYMNILRLSENETAVKFKMQIHV